MSSLRADLVARGWYRGMQPAGTDVLSSPIGKTDGRITVPCVTLAFPTKRRSPMYWRATVNGRITEYTVEPTIATIIALYQVALKELIDGNESL